MAKPVNDSGADNSPMDDGQYDEHTTTPIIDNCNSTHLVHTNDTMTNNYLHNFLPPPPPPPRSSTKRSPTLLQPRKQHSSTPVRLYLLDQQLNSSVLLSAVSSSISCSSSADSIDTSHHNIAQYKQQLPTTTIKMNFSRVGSWKAKKKEAKAKKLQRSSGSTPIMSNRKKIDNPIPLATSSSTNLFLQMNDEEVGNHTPNTSPATSMSPNRKSSVVTSSTSPTTSLSTPDRSGKERGSQSPEDRALGGIKFHPHHAVVPDNTSSPVKSRGMKQTEKRSPKSVMTDSLHNHSESMGASSSDSTQLTGTPPRKQKEFFTLKQQQSQSQGKQKKKSQPINNVDSSLASEVEDSKSYATNTVTDNYTYNDETTNGESTFVPGSISDQANPSIGIGTRLGIMVGKKLEHKIHDFIIGNLCWSLNDDGTTKSVTDGVGAGGIMSCNNAAVQCADLQTTESMIDDIRNYNYESSDDEDEEDSTTLDTNSFEDTMSYYTSDDDEEDDDDDRYKRKKKSNKSHQLTKSKKKKVLHKKPPSGKQSRRGPNRRGRSPTSKLSYNSDGESLVSGMSRGTSRGNSSRANSSISTYGDRAASLSVSTNRSSKSRGASSSAYRDKTVLDKHNEASASSSSDGSLNGKGRDPSVVESVLSNDQAAWMAMTKQQASTDDSELALLAGNMNNDKAEGEVQEASAVDGYFKKLLTVGIQLTLNDPPTSEQPTRLNRNGKMFLQFGERNNAAINQVYNHPQLVWTDGNDVSYTLELLDIQSIRPPTFGELDEHYPFSVEEHSFFITTHSGISLLFEAVDELQMTRIVSGLQGIAGRLAKKIIMGENDWIVQMMLTSVGVSGEFKSLDELENDMPDTFAIVTDHFVDKTTTLTLQKPTGIMKGAYERRSRLRSNREVMLTV